MNKLKLYEAINLIDDDIVEEASEAQELGQTDTLEENEIIVSGVEPYRRPVWRRFAAVAASVLLIAGLCAAGGAYLKTRKFTDSDENIAAPATTGTRENSTAQPEESCTSESTDNSGEHIEFPTELPSVTETEPGNTTNTLTTTWNNRITTPSDTNGYTGTPATVTAVTTTAPRKTTAVGTTTGKNDHPPYVPKGEGMLSTKDLIELSQKGDDLTWSDFEGYDFEDIGSGLYIWRFYIQEGYVLLVGGGDTDQKPYYINLYQYDYYFCKSQEAPNGGHIDIRYDDVEKFINNGTVIDTDDPWYPIMSINYATDIMLAEAGYTMFRDTIPLTYEQVDTLLDKLQGIKLEGRSDEWMAMSGNFAKIRLVFRGDKEYQLRISPSYVIIDNVGYKADYEASKAVYDFIYTAAADGQTKKQKITVKSGEVWCWHDCYEERSLFRDYSEIIELTDFPGYKLKWLGTQNTISIEKDGNDIAYVSGMPIISAFITDITGDGYPDLCTSSCFGSGIVNELITVYDIRNDKTYKLDARGKYDYFLSLRSGKLVVNEYPLERGDSYGRSGHLGFSVKSGLEFIADGTVTTMQVKEINGKQVLVTPGTGVPERSSSDLFKMSANDMDFTPEVGMWLLVTYDGRICESYPAIFAKIYDVKNIS